MRTKDIIAAVAIGVIVTKMLDQRCVEDRRCECEKSFVCPPPPKPPCKCVYKRYHRCD